MIAPRSGSTARDELARDVRRAETVSIDEQKLLLDAQREVGLVAEAVLHGRQSTAAVAE